MENKAQTMVERAQENQDDAEEIWDEFLCCVCLELLYKPVVLACGHMSCFWCVFKAMDSWHESRCPVCRHPYGYFPSVCQLMHFLFLKLYPVAYTRREKQVEEEEKEVGYFSPQLGYNLLGSQLSEESNILVKTSPSSPIRKTNFGEHYPSREGESSSIENSSGSIIHHTDNTKNIPVTFTRSSEAMLLGNYLQNGSCKPISIADVLCVACKKLLFRPVVLNCGHVYCECCIAIPVDGLPRCQDCQSIHPNLSPSVCLPLEHFLEEHFPIIYAQRRESSLQQTDCSKQACQHTTKSSVLPTADYTAWMFGNGPKVHIGAGCDFCGMCPIIGERYKCKDCTEKIGFDLCESCYNSPSKVPGRFNQQHKPDHKFEIVKPRGINEVILRFSTELSDDGSDDPEDPEDFARAALVMLSDAVQDPENLEEEVSDANNLVHNTEHEPEDDSNAHCPYSSDLL